MVLRQFLFVTLLAAFCKNTIKRRQADEANAYFAVLCCAFVDYVEVCSTLLTCVVRFLETLEHLYNKGGFADFIHLRKRNMPRKGNARETVSRAKIFSLSIALVKFAIAKTQRVIWVILGI